ncbi:MAG: NAD-dependent epimerase/dehydratase family protein, partial [Candidatus Kariarchaeaceae archaeon]
MSKEELHTVFGATGSTGSALVKELVNKGKNVRGVNRSGDADLPESIEVAKADALDFESMKKAAQESTHIYHCMGLPSYAVWAEKFPTMMNNVIEAAASQGSETKVIYIDNLYMYGKESALKGPLTEDTPHLASGKKGMLRSKLANQLLQAHNEGRLKATIGRGSDFFGPSGKSSIYDIFVFPKVIQGKKVRMFGNLDKLHSVMY